MSKSINISTSLRQTINDTVDLSSCVSATDWNEENIELDTDVLNRLANLESEMIENSNAIDVLEANQFTLVNYDGSVGDIEIPDNNESLSEQFVLDTIAQTTNDELLTQDKHIIGAINEVFQSGVSVKQQLVDALTAKGIEGISTSDSFEVLIGKIADFSTSSSPIEGCDLIAVTELPASGDPDSLYILTSIEPNVIHVGREQPEKSVMALGDIWIDLDAHEDTNKELRTLTIGAISINFRMRSCYQKTSEYNISDLTEVFAYSWTGTEWERVVPVIIPVIAATSTTYEYEALDTTYVGFTSSGTKTIYFKKNYQGEGTLVMYHAFHFGNGADTIKLVAKVYDEYGTLYNTVTHSKTLNQAFKETTATIDVLPSGYINITATLTNGAEITAYLNVYCKKA